MNPNRRKYGITAIMISSMGIRVFYNLQCDYCIQSEVKPFTEVAEWDLHGEFKGPNDWRFTGPDGIQLVCSDKCEDMAREYWTEQVRKSNSNT